jgi:hypothetical protein
VAKIIKKTSPVRKAINTTVNKTMKIGFESSIPLWAFLDCSDFMNKGTTFDDSIFEFSTFIV